MLGLASVVVVAACRTASSTPPDTVTIPAPSGGAPAPPPPADSPEASTPSAASTDASAPPGAASADSDHLPAELFACAADADCTAIPPGGCCFLGRLVAVNAGQADAYKRATPCNNPHQKCPQIRMMENRTPRCVAGRCEMVAP